MAEAALAAGASAIGFIGLSGQILPGYPFVSDCLGDVEEAPKELQNILDQLKSVESGIRNFYLDARLGPVSAKIVKSSVEVALKDFISNLSPETGTYTLSRNWSRKIFSHGNQ
ncbi:hypothetical protein DSL72_002986 [Monilinia vaccinii-corymbosi]|uniref:Uncharacterized protein n=1 Tax=Monilinia vaccinii-corymbosi TaxID=61207 RepID=A0A8A3PE44_9HELO|nr:hypothetical protein DSL72_002986 [Monilinia vaccinii-corymbosi]